MNTSCRICLSSPPDRKKVVAEVFFENQQWAELNQEGQEVEVEFYPRMDGQPWRIFYSQAVAALEEARRRLIRAHKK